MSSFFIKTIGRDANGRMVRKTVTAKTRAEVVRKLRKLQRQLDDGLPAPDTTLTVAQLLNRWHEDVLRHQVAPSAAFNYRAVADRYIVPTLGSRKVASRAAVRCHQVSTALRLRVCSLTAGRIRGCSRGRSR